MAIYITQGRYTAAAIRGMADKPEDRREAVEALMKSAGFKLHAYYMTFGDYDFITIAEGNGTPDMLAPLIVAAATGGVTDLKTTQGFTPAEFKAACERAGRMIHEFKPAGG